MDNDNDNDNDHHTAYLYLAQTKEEACLALASYEEESKQYMAHAESMCRKIKASRILFSAESVNRGNLKRKCRKLNILRPHSTSQ